MSRYFVYNLLTVKDTVGTGTSNNCSQQCYMFRYGCCELVVGRGFVELRKVLYLSCRFSLHVSRNGDEDVSIKSYITFLFIDSSTLYMAFMSYKINLCK